MAAKTILVVDYEPNSLQKYKALLEANSYRVETATDGLMAVKRFEEVKPNLVLLSAMLPKLHGFEACQKIKSTGNGEAIPVIIMTNIYKGKKYRHDALTKYGASEYLEKPFEDDLLLDHVKTLLTTGATRPKIEDLDRSSSEPEADEEIPDLIDDDDDIPDLIDEEDGGSDRTITVPAPTAAARAPAPPPSRSAPAPPRTAPAAAFKGPAPTRREEEETISAPSLSSLAAEFAAEEEVEEIEEVEEVIGDDEQTITVDPELVGRAVAAAQAKALDMDEKKSLSSRDIFSEVISEVEAEVGGSLKQMARDRGATAASRQGAHFVGRPEPEPPEVEDFAEEPAAAPAYTVRTPATARSEQRPTTPPSLDRPSEKPRTGEMRSLDEMSDSSFASAALKDPTASGRLDAAGRTSQDVFKQKLEETLTGLGIPVKKEVGKKEPTVRLIKPMPAPPPEARPSSRSTGQLPTPTTLPSAAAQAVEEGISFGNYSLLEKIAAGGMAELFKAKMQGVEGFKKLVAIKRILPHLTDNDEFVHMFIDEAKLAAQLNHQNIAHIFDLGRIDKFYYIAMEYVAGQDLRAILKHLADKGEKGPIELSVLIASKIASALDYAHRKKDFDGKDLNIVHRDISPQNILISYEGEVKLVDFGIAKAVSRSSQTESGTVKGKLLYMSPEQARGVEIDKRSDIFSLGVVLYEMLTGEKLFMDETEMEIIRRVRDCKVSSPRRINMAIPKELDMIVMTALEKRPEDRYQNAYKMQKDLENIMYAWESTPTSVNLAQFMAEEFRREVAAANADGTVNLGDWTPAPGTPMYPAVSGPTTSPSSPKPRVSPSPPKSPPPPRREARPAPPPPVEEDVEVTMLGSDRTTLAPPQRQPEPQVSPWDLGEDDERTMMAPPKPAPAAPKPPASKAAPGKKAEVPQAAKKPTAPAASMPKGGPPRPAPAKAPSAGPRSPSATRGMIMPDTGMIRVGKEEVVNELAGKGERKGVPLLFVGLGGVGLIAVIIIVVAVWALLHKGTLTVKPPPTVTPTATPSPTASAPSPSPSVAASPTPSATAPPPSPSASPSPSVPVPTQVATRTPPPPVTPSPSPTTPTPAIDAGKISRVEDNLRAMNASRQSADWEATRRSADRVLKDDPQNAQALAARKEADAKISEKKQLAAEAQKQQLEADYQSAMEGGKEALGAGDIPTAEQKVGTALKLKPKDKGALALRREIDGKKKQIASATATPPPVSTPTAATPKATPTATATPKPTKTPATPAGPSLAEEWTAKIKAALAAPNVDVAEVEKLFEQAQSEGVPRDVLQPLYSEFQIKRPRPVENSFVSLEQLDSRPEIVSKVEPTYTRQAELQKLKGTVLIEATIDASGDVVATSVTRSLGSGLDENAEKAVKKYKFRPGEKQGVKVKTKITIPVNFQGR